MLRAVVIVAMVYLVVLLVAVVRTRQLKLSEVKHRLRRPTGTTLGKPDEIQESYHRALDEIHRAACYGKRR